MTKLYGTPGPRAIHPSVCTSKSLGTCSILAQLLFDRLIAQADDQGRLEDGAAYVRGVCLPMVPKVTVSAVESALSELAAAGMIRRYQADGRDLLQLLGWWGYQSGMRWRYPSRHAAPEGWGDLVKVPGPDGKTPEPDGKTPSPDGTIPPSRADRRPPVDRTVPDRTGPDPTVPDPPAQGWDEPEGEALTWLARHGCYIRPGNGYHQKLVLAVTNHGVNAVVGMFDRLSRAGVKDGDDKGFVFGAIDALNGKPDLKALEREEREDETRDRTARRVAATKRMLAEQRGERLADA